MIVQQSLWDGELGILQTLFVPVQRLSEETTRAFRSQSVAHLWSLFNRPITQRVVVIGI